MKQYFLLILLLSMTFTGFSQTNRVINFFPKGTILHGNIPYNNDTISKHLLDIYIPQGAKENIPLVIFVHGGAWMVNDKYADMGYMKKTVSEIVENGYALASIDYRFSTQAIFPAQIQDCYRAVSYLVDNAGKFGFDTSKIAVMGFSAGGHLASLLGLAKNNNVDSFFMPESNRSFSFKGVIDFYGPAELIMFPGSNDIKSPESILIGATPISRPDLAKVASPVTYVDKNDPPFLIIHGEKDDMVSPKQSMLLSSWLTIAGVPNELVIVKDAPHYGEMFDAEEVRNKVMTFLKRNLNQ